VAPELWRLDFEHEKDLSANVENGLIVLLPLPGGIDPKDIQDLTWGDASFAGPCHDVIVCDVDDHIRFYQFERNDIKSPPVNIQEISTARPISYQDFSDFSSPIYTWGGMALKPVMAATDIKGAGSVCVWTVPDL